LPERVTVIVNPAAGRGRGARVLPRVRAVFGSVGVTDVRVTGPGPGQGEAALARRAVGEGATTIVAAGGDGTWSNVANAILGTNPDCRLGLIASGTGNDFAKTAGAPARDLALTARLAVEGEDSRVDVGRIEERYFLNIAGFGFDIAILEDIPRVRLLRGDAVYVCAALRQLLRYDGLDIEVHSPRGGCASTRHLLLILANARHAGGAFRIAPHASLTDGLLDAIAIHDARPRRRLALLAAATRGTHLRHPEVKTASAPSFQLSFAQPPAYETDGEYRRAATTRLDVRCVPSALRIVAPGA
jgi:diacylglycerol kinase (ATP)